MRIHYLNAAAGDGGLYGTGPPSTRRPFVGVPLSHILKKKLLLCFHGRRIYHCLFNRRVRVAETVLALSETRCASPLILRTVLQRQGSTCVERGLVLCTY